METLKEIKSQTRAAIWQLAKQKFKMLFPDIDIDDKESVKYILQEVDIIMDFLEKNAPPRKEA